MNKILFNPLIAPLCTLLYVCLFCLFLWPASADYLFYFADHQLEIITAICYVISLPIIIYVIRDFKTAEERRTYYLFFFLWICAVLREAGIQHWLTQTDTTAFKIRFFTNPNNPLYEKLVAGYLLLTVVAVGIYLLIRFTPKIFKGFFKADPLYWTICTLGGMGILAKLADRIPGNYAHITGTFMAPEYKAHFELVEEVCETTLPLLFAFAFVQYHFMQKDEKERLVKPDQKTKKR